jgi:3-phenylpropionate/trans-cinnamate dioxygenase ferredoxin reductase subunit
MSGAIAIVGAGECGGRAALTLRAEGYDGPITLIGDEPHLPYERPPLSKGLTVGPKFIASEADYAAAGIQHRASSWATSIDRAAKAVVLRSGERVPYDTLLLATGARPRRLPQNGIVYLRTYDDAQAIRARLTAGTRLLLIGAGFIGLELAASARELGAGVRVVEMQPRILMRGVPEEIAAVIHARHVAEGVEIVTGATMPAFDADIVVAGIGSIPNTELASAAGLMIDNGIAVDEHLRASDPDIYAAGDCCSFPLALYGGRRVRLESWRNAGEQGALAARNMVGANEAISAVPWFYSDQYDLGLQVAGLADGAARTVRRDLGNGAFILFHLAADGTLLAASGIGPGNAVAKDIKLAELLIGRRARPAPDLLAQADVKLKSLLAA